MCYFATSAKTFPGIMHKLLILQRKLQLPKDIVFLGDFNVWWIKTPSSKSKSYKTNKIENMVYPPLYIEISK